MSYLINKVGESAVLPDGKKYVAVADPKGTPNVCRTLCAGRRVGCDHVKCISGEFYLKLVEESHNDRD